VEIFSNTSVMLGQACGGVCVEIFDEMSISLFTSSLTERTVIRVSFRVSKLVLYLL